jgi:hypothetical protein
MPLTQTSPSTPLAPEPTGQLRGQWLREQRRARGWNIALMSRKLREAARTADDAIPGTQCLTTMIRRWEQGAGISERYQLHYCRAFSIPPDRFASTPPGSRQDNP